MGMIAGFSELSRTTSRISDLENTQNKIRTMKDNMMNQADNLAQWEQYYQQQMNNGGQQTNNGGQQTNSQLSNALYQIQYKKNCIVAYEKKLDQQLLKAQKDYDIATKEKELYNKQVDENIKRTFEAKG